jgi:hypothetical protein
VLKTQVSIKLDKQMDCNYICNHIQGLINHFSQQNIDLSQYLLVCSLKEITNTDQNLLLRIGHNNE